MQSDDVTRGAVELRYGLTREDLLDGFAAQYWAAKRPWYLRWPFFSLLIATGGLGYVIAVALALDGRLSIAWIAVALLPIVLAVVLAVPRLLYRQAVRQLLRANPAFSQPMTVSVSAAGISTAGPVGEARVNWAQYPFHAETERVFSLFASDRLGGAVQVLPKRGLSNGDPQPLRTLLASHSQRLGR